MEDTGHRGAPSAKIIAELSALADGTLDPEREPAVRQLIAADPELSERYERERQAVARLHTLRADRAPDRLRARLEGQRRAATRRAPAAGRPRARLLYGGAAALAVVLLIVILLLPGGAPGAPSVSQAAALALRGSTSAAPPADPSRPGRLKVDVDDVYFPNLARSLGYRAVGQRSDRLDGSEATTVYYANGARTIAYTIVAASLPLRPVASAVWGAPSVRMHTLMIGTRWVIAWRRAGDTCVVSGGGLSKAELAAFAA